MSSFTSKTPVIKSNRERTTAGLLMVFGGVLLCFGGIMLVFLGLKWAEHIDSLVSSPGAVLTAEQIGWIALLALSTLGILQCFFRGLVLVAMNFTQFLDPSLPEHLHSAFQKPKSRDLHDLLNQHRIPDRRLKGTKWIILEKMFPKLGAMPNEYQVVARRAFQFRRLIYVAVLSVIAIIPWRNLVPSFSVETPLGLVTDASVGLALDELALPWILLVLIAIAYLVDLIVVVGMPKMLVSCATYTSKIRMRECGDPVSLYFSIEEILESGVRGDQEFKKYAISREPQVGVTQAGETDRFEASMYFEFPSECPHPKLPGVAGFYLVLGIVLAGCGGILLGVLPLLVSPASAVATLFTALAFYIAATGIGPKFIRTGINMARTYRLENDFVRLLMRGVYGSQMFQRIENDGTASRESRRYSDVMVRADSARLVTEFRADRKATSERILVSAIPSEALEARVTQILGAIEREAVALRNREPSVGVVDRGEASVRVQDPSRMIDDQMDDGLDDLGA